VATGALAALAAALCWTVASSLWRRLPTSLSSARLNLLKNLLALGLQVPLVLVLGGLGLPSGAWGLLALSGVMGIALGDSLFFAALRRLGTRRTLTIDAGGPAVTALAGAAFLGEGLAGSQWLGIALISGAVLVVVRRQPVVEAGHAAVDQGLGVLYALGALACGSSGALLARSALREEGLSPLQAATIRLACAAVVMLPLLRGLNWPPPLPQPAMLRWPRVLVATVLGTSVGIVLQQAALQRLPGGVAVALMATAPVMALPLARLEGDRPGGWGLTAALMALAGVGLSLGLGLGPGDQLR
jgi:drug/metabolite transporter (DMT)-like permease